MVGNWQVTREKIGGKKTNQNSVVSTHQSELISHYYDGGVWFSMQRPL